MSTTASVSSLGIALNRVLSVIVFGLAPVIVVLTVLGWTYSGPNFLFDFHGGLYTGAHDLTIGENPYRLAFLAHLATVARAGGHPSAIWAVPVYPAPDFLLAAPLGLLPFRTAGIAFSLLGIMSLGAALRVLGVRDWRCYGAVLLSWPVVQTIRLGQTNEFVVLAVALAWRWRASVVPSALATTGAILGSLFVWPIGVFLLLTRRWRAALLAAATAVGASIIAWAFVGFAGFTSYPRMLSDLSSIVGRDGISLLAFGSAVGLPHLLTVALMIVLTIGLITLAWLLLRRDRESGEARAFGLLLIAGMTSTSLLWPHHLTLLFVPIALLSPTFGRLWLAPLLAYLAPVELTHGSAWRIAVYLAIELLVALALVGPRRFARPTGLPSADRMDRPEGERATGRLAHGL